MISLSVVSPEKKVLELECLQATIPTTSGLITVLPHHAPLFSVLASGEVVIKTNDKDPIYLAVSGGFVSVHNNQLILLTDFGVRSEEIDEKVVAEAKVRAEKAMQEKVSPEMLEEARMELARASIQLEVANRRKHHRSPTQGQ